MDYNNEEDYDTYLPHRNDAIYKEIESFEDYELTQCVAYEMAIRDNEEIKNISPIAFEHSEPLLSNNEKYTLNDIEIFQPYTLAKIVNY